MQAPLLTGLRCSQKHSLWEGSTGSTFVTFHTSAGSVRISMCSWLSRRMDAVEQAMNARFDEVRRLLAGSWPPTISLTLCGAQVLRVIAGGVGSAPARGALGGARSRTPPRVYGLTRTVVLPTVWVWVRVAPTTILRTGPRCASRLPQPRALWAWRNSQAPDLPRTDILRRPAAPSRWAWTSTWTTGKRLRKRFGRSRSLSQSRGRNLKTNDGT